MNDRLLPVSQVPAVADGALVSLRGEHDLATTPALRDEFARARAQSDRITVDLTACDFLDSSVLGVLIGELRRARERDGALILVLSPNPANTVRRTLELTGLLGLFDIRDGES